jgi:hypothetical protein
MLVINWDKKGEMHMKTELLPPITAVRMVWAMTGKFSDDEPSNRIAAYVEDSLKQIEDRALASTPKEKGYIISAIATMRASLRSLDNAYKSRSLNFQENEKLRLAYLDSIKESLDFGDKIQDFLKSLPTMTITAAGGVTLLQLLPGKILPEVSWGIGIGLAALGYLINLWFVRRARHQTQVLYVRQDYERNLYYDQYVRRTADIIHGLILDLERIHKHTFGENYETDLTPNAIEETIEKILTGVRSTFCIYAHKHMIEKKITPEIWAMCESGHTEGIKMCQHWEGLQKNRQT